LRGDHRIDRAAAAIEHGEARLRSERMSGCDHVAFRVGERLRRVPGRGLGLRLRDLPGRKERRDRKRREREAQAY